MRFAGAARALMENRHLLFLSLVVILAAGASALGSLPLTEDPRIAMRGPIVLTRLPGASPERVEALVSEKIEEKLEEVAKIKEIDSTSRAGISVVAISLADDVYDTQEVFAEIRDQLAAAAPLLPPEASTPVFDDKRGTNSYSLIAAITLDDDQHLGIASRLAEDLADRLRTVTGTELVRLFGEPEEELVALIDDRELSALGLVASDVATLLRESDSKTPSGRLRGADSDVVMEVEGAFDTVDRVRRVPIRRAADGAVLRVADVARIERRWREPTTEIARVDGTRAVFVAARMGPSERASEWAGRAQRVVEDFEQQLGGAGSPVQLSVVFDQSGYTVERLGSLGSNLLLGGVAVVLVVLLTMGLRAGLVVGATLPLTASLALFGLLLVGGSLQQMSIFGLIMALGLLIDNAIVMVDEVAARLRRGADRRRAVTQAVAHLFLPLFASTLTTVLSFAPIPLLMGNVGDFVGPIGVSVVLALIASFAVSMTVVPALAGLFLRPHEEGSRASGWLDRGLMLPGLTARARRGLEAGMRRPFVAMGVAASIPIVGFAVAPALDSQFFPPVDRNMFDVQVWLPRDASLERTDEVVARVEDVLREQPAVERVSWLVGGSFPSVFYNLLMNKDDAAYYARGVVETGTAAEVKAMLPDLQRALAERVPDAQVVARSFGQGPPVDAEVEIEIRGPGLETLQALGEAVRVQLARHPDVLHTQVTLDRGDPKLWVRVDEDETRSTGLSLRDVANQLERRLEGAAGGSMVDGFEELPVRVRTEDAERADREGLASFRLVRREAGTGGEGWLPLDAIGEVELRPAIGGITRCEGMRCNTVGAYLRAGAYPIDVTRAVVDGLAESGFELPVGYTLSVGGDSEEQNRAITSLLTYAPILGILMVATVVLAFRSARLAVLLFSVAGLSVGVGLLATWLAGFPFSFNTILGTAGLIGVALNDSIVVLAALREDERARRGEIDAVVDAVLGCGRHVLSTTFTTIAGFVPLLLFVGGDFWPPLAIVLAGGVGGATILATLFVPAGYCLLAPGLERTRATSFEAVPVAG